MMDSNSQNQSRIIKIDISYKTFLFGLFLILSFKFIYSILDLLVLVYLAFLLSLSIDPLINVGLKLKLNRLTAVLIGYVVFIILVSGFVAVLIPPLIVQSQLLIINLPHFLDNFNWNNFDYTQITFLIDKFSNVPVNVFKTIIGIVGNLINLITLLVLSFYISLERPFFDSHIKRWFGNNQISSGISRFLDLASQQLRRWLVGELFLMLVVGVLSYIGLILFGISYALPLAMLAGLLEVVPNLGPFLSAVPPALIGFSVSPLLGAGIIGWYFLVQQVENNFLVPKIIGGAVGLHPFLILFTLMVGFRLGGIGGALLSIPVLITIRAGLQAYLINQRRKI